MIEREKRRTANIRGQLYVYDGNTIKQGQAIPEVDIQKKKKKQEKKVSRQTRKNQKRAMKLGFGYVSFLGAAAAIALFVCFQYIGVRADLSRQSRTIEKLRTDISEIRESNASEYNFITNSITLETIRKRAEELGMVYADPSQVVTYQSPGDDYIKKYENIPEDGIVDEN